MPSTHRNLQVRPRGPSALLGAIAVGLALGFAAPMAVAQAPSPEIAARLKVLDVFLGSWDVTVNIRQPTPAVVTYTETYEWALGGHFLRGDSGTKSDGTRDLVIATYDAATDGYPFWIFSSSGAWYYLEAGAWDEGSRSLTWKNPPQMNLWYLTRCVFPDDRTRHCSALVKDWKGTVLLEQETSAVRRR